MVSCPDEGFFALHSWATEQEKDKIWVQNSSFLANLKKFKPLVKQKSLLKSTFGPNIISLRGIRWISMRISNNYDIYIQYNQLIVKCFNEITIL